MKTSYEDFLKRVRNNNVVGASESLKKTAASKKKKTLDDPAGELKRRRKAIEDHPGMFKNQAQPPRGYTPGEWEDYRKRHYGKK